MTCARERERVHDEPDAPCHALEWDSHHFGCRIARVQCQLTPATAQGAIAWCRENHVDCLYLTVACNDAQAVRVAEANGFQLVDLRVTLEHQLVGPLPPPPSVRLCRESDIPALSDIAAASHVHTRFYADGRFPRERCDALYRAWIERSCRGWADAVLVADHDGWPVGYVACHLHPNQTGSVGLMAVAAGHRGFQLGTQLVNAALQFFLDHGRTRVLVVTQGRNLEAQRLYQRCGFVTESMVLHYHRWFVRSSTHDLTAS
jgi:dTDP-4-amino-4,6-dideoxy-D-galactose acyltransferase